MEAASKPSITAVRPKREVMTSQRVPYFIGISGETVGASSLSMHLVVIPPGARSEPQRMREGARIRERDKGKAGQGANQVRVVVDPSTGVA